jgi:hypothetical protein
MRNFKINGVQFRTIKRFAGSSETNEYNKKYDLMHFNENFRGWIRICSANTLTEAKEKAEEWAERNK